MTNPRTARLRSRVGLVAATVLAVGGVSATAAAPSASASTATFGQGVYACAQMMLPYSIDSRGSITMLMSDGTMMQWLNFGAMVTYMRSHEMCQ